MSDVALSLLRLIVLLVLLGGPVFAFAFVQHRLPSKALRLALAAVFAVCAGFAASAAAGSIGLVLQARTARVAVPTAAAFPVFFGFTLVVLGVLALRPTTGASALTPRPSPPSRHAPELVSAAAPAWSPPAPQARPATHRRVFWILIAIYGSALLAWPFLSFGAAFAFDDPNGNRALAWYIAASIWLYPAFVVVGFLWGYYNRNPSLSVQLLKTSVPLLSAIWFFLVPGIPLLLRAWLLEPSVEEVVQQRGELEARLDPIYAERATLIRARNPEADAREAIGRGEVALLPYTPGSDDYLGVEGPTPLDAATSRRVIERSEVLGSIVGLLREDDTHPRSRMGDRETYDYAIYYSETFKDFLAARRDYMTRFNTVVAQHLKATP